MELKDLFSPRGFHIAHLNIRSLFPKIDVFKYLVQSARDIDIVGVPETWLNDNLTSDFIDIQGYTFVRTDKIGI